MGREREENNKKHYVLVHGACHGAWCWHKVKPGLEAAGHRVTVVDMAASGVNGRNLEEVTSMSDYSKPLVELMGNLGSEERVVLVGHSLGGLSVALAIDNFPNNVALAVFLTAFMPDTLHNPSFVLQQFIERTSKEAWLDTEFSPCGSITSMLFGPNFLSSKLYQLSSTEDLELAKTLIRPSSLFVEDLSKSNNFSEQGYGSVPRGYIICKQDMAIPLEFQKWMIQNDGHIREVLEIQDADHMPMFSTPHQLCDALLQIASNYH